MSVKHFVQKLEEDLECSVCFLSYTLPRTPIEPKVLPCQHTFCKECVSRFISSSSSTTIKCPECRDEHDVPPQGAEGFKNNYTIIRLLNAKKELPGMNT